MVSKQLRNRNSEAFEVFLGNLPVNCELSLGGRMVLGDFFGAGSEKLPIMINLENRNPPKI